MVKLKSVRLVDTSDISDGAVTTEKIANASVITDKIADSAVTLAKIAESAVGTTQLVDSAVTQAKIAAAAVGTDQIADSAVTQVKIAASAVGPVQVSNEVIQFGAAAIDSVATWITFPVAFPGTPEVVATGLDVTGVKISAVTAASFEWVASAAGSARWVAVYRG